jgi:hypothetical protein
MTYKIKRGSCTVGAGTVAAIIFKNSFLFITGLCFKVLNWFIDNGVKAEAFNLRIIFVST